MGKIVDKNSYLELTLDLPLLPLPVAQPAPTEKGDDSIVIFEVDYDINKNKLDIN